MPPAGSVILSLFRPLVRTGVAVIAILVATSCGESPTDTGGRVAVIEINHPDALSLTVSESVQLDVVARNVRGDTLRNAPIVWSVKDTSIAVIGAAGLLTARAVGNTYVVAASGEVRDSVPLAVRAVPVAQILVLNFAVLGRGRTLTLDAQPMDSAGHAVTGHRLQWTSSDRYIATVDSSGVVSAVGHGVAVIMVRSGNALARTRIKVVPAVSEVYVGLTHVCVLDEEGRAYCWGTNGDGELGTGDRESASVLRPVAGGHVFTRLALGERITCGRTVESRILCWGRNYLGQLGTGDFERRLLPTPVLASASFADVIAGEDHVCALDSDGLAYCWGSNTLGVLGGGMDDLGATVPTRVAGDTRFRQITSGASNSTCALSNSGDYFCWGSARFTHEPGIAACDSMRCNEPVRVSGAPRFEEIAGSYAAQCGLTADHAVYCVNYNFSTPALIGAGLEFTSLSSAAAEEMCGLTTDGTGYCWNGFDDIPTPVRVGADVALAAIVGGWLDTFEPFVRACGITVHGVGYCWRDSLDAPELLPIP